MTENPQCVRAFRDELALHVIREAQRLYPQAIHFHFNTSLQKVDLNRQMAHISTAGSDMTEVCCICHSPQLTKLSTALVHAVHHVLAAVLSLSKQI